MTQQHQNQKEFSFKIGELEVDGIFQYTYYSEYFPSDGESAPEYYTHGERFDYPEDITYYLNEEEVCVVKANAYYDEHHSTMEHPDLKDWVKSELKAELQGVIS